MGRGALGRLPAATAAVVLLALLAPVTAGSVAVPGPDYLQFPFRGSIQPGLLPAKQGEPAALHLGGRLENFEGARPPALRKLRLEGDRSVDIDVSDVPVCRARRLPDTPSPWRGCQDSIVGHGVGVTTFAYPENTPIDEFSELVVYNGGVRKGVLKLWLRGYIEVAGLGSIVIPVKVGRIDEGAYGWRADLSIPELGEGYGSLLSFNLTLGKRATSARCPREVLSFRSSAQFEDGSFRQSSFSVDCVSDDRRKAAKLVADNPIGIFSSDFSPKRLPETKPAPVRFSVSGNLGALAEHPPALKELLLKGDRHTRMSVKGVPTVEDTCRLNGPRRGVPETRKACGAAVIGDGRLDLVVQFPDQPPIPIASELLVLNGGIDGGVTRLYLFSYFTAPVTAAIVTTMEIRKIDEGRYGWEAIATLPKIAGGSGSVTRFKIALKRGVLSATCPNGRLDFHNAALFADGTRVTQRVARTCTPRD